MSTVTAPVAVVSAGARASLGRSLPAIAAAVRANIRVVGEHAYAIDRKGRRLAASFAPWLPQSIEGSARFAALAKNAAKEALGPTLKAIGYRGKARVFVGLPEPRPGRPDDLESTVLAALGTDAPWAAHVDRVEPIAMGHASALVAFEQAIGALRRGDAELCLAGGVDSYLDGDTMQWLHECGRLQTPSRPYGFTPGEGAAFCLLASDRWIEKHAAAARMSIIEVHSAHEPARRGTRKVCVGEGLARAMNGALAPVRAAGEHIDVWIGDLNGETYRADEAGFALSRMAERHAR